MTEQKTSKSPMNESDTKPWGLSLTTFPVIPWFKNTNPERSANAENAAVTFLFLRKFSCLAIDKLGMVALNVFSLFSLCVGNFYKLFLTRIFMVNGREKYLRRLEKLKKRDHKGPKDNESPSKDSFHYPEVKKLLEEDPHNDYLIEQLARKVGQEGFQSGNMKSVFLGMELYERLGQGKKHLPLTVQALESYSKQRGFLSNREYQTARRIVERNTSDVSPGLEGKTIPFGLAIIGGIALSLSSLSATGNVVSNLTQTSQGLAGIFLFVIGLAGLVFSLKKK
jgi:hypothetical protein